MHSLWFERRCLNQDFSPSGRESGKIQTGKHAIIIHEFFKRSTVFAVLDDFDVESFVLACIRHGMGGIRQDSASRGNVRSDHQSTNTLYRAMGCRSHGVGHCLSHRIATAIRMYWHENTIDLYFEFPAGRTCLSATWHAMVLSGYFDTVDVAGQGKGFDIRSSRVITSTEVDWIATETVDGSQNRLLVTCQQVYRDIAAQSIP